jgi:GNAT superfamily N-acetyltransferase
MPPADTSCFSIRSLEAGDRTAWERLWLDYLVFYQTALAPEVTDATWTRLLDLAEPVHGLVAERDGTLLGIVHYLYHRSTWSVGSYCYLQDLFTSEAARGQGVGTALIEAVHARAEAAGASRVYWLTHETNGAARALYDRLATRTGFIQYKRMI